MIARIPPSGSRLERERRWYFSGRVILPVGIAVAGLAASLIWDVGLLGFVATAACVALGAGSLALHKLHIRFGIVARRLSNIVGDDATGPGWARIMHHLDLLDERRTLFDQRWNHSHRVTGLATREPLLARMEADGRGTLGVIAFPDFDRICAFDPALGDRMLGEIAARVRRMVGSERSLAHVDRFHFALWFGPETPETEAAAELAAICYALGAPIREGERDFVPETRHQHGGYSRTDEQPGAALARLIAACSLSGGAAPSVPGEATAASARDHYTIEQDLRDAIRSNQLELRFQPQIDAVAGRVSGVEALLRWNHPQRGMVSPALFIPIVEAAGLIDEFGMWALNAACREATRWRTAGLGQLRVAVNVSGHQLASPDMLKRIERTIARHALPQRMLDIELTESAATQDIARAGELFDALRARGIEISIDDFGTGFSSLTALRSLAFDKIKIDRAFVTEVDRRRDSQAICQSVIALGRGLGIRVLAEGVETFEEYAWLRQHGCTEFQGFYFAPPLTSEAFRAFARNRAYVDSLLALDPRASQRTIAQRIA